MGYYPYLVSAALGMASAAIVAGCSHSHPAATQTETPVIDVAEATQRGVTLYHTYPGKLHARSSIDLVARVDGYLKGQHYKNGDLVEAGQLLFTIEDTQYRNAVAQAESELKAAESALDYNTAHYEAVKQAADANAASRMEVEQARSAMESSRQDVNNARAALSTARTNLDYCYVKAPFKGHVGASGPGIGSYLSGGGAPVTLATIYDDLEVKAEFFIDDASYIDMLRDENKAIVADLDSIPVSFSDKLPHSYTGRLIYMSPDIDPSTGTLEMRAMIANPYDELRDGMYVTVKLPYASESDAVLVKDASISTDQHGKYLYTVNDSDRVVYTPVEVGDVVDDSLRVITSGIRPGDRYVTKALLKVRPDMLVKPRLSDNK